MVRVDHGDFLAGWRPSVGLCAGQVRTAQHFNFYQRYLNHIMADNWLLIEDWRQYAVRAVDGGPNHYRWVVLKCTPQSHSSWKPNRINFSSWIRCASRCCRRNEFIAGSSLRCRDLASATQGAPDSPISTLHSSRNVVRLSSRLPLTGKYLLAVKKKTF